MKLGRILALAFALLFSLTVGPLRAQDETHVSGLILDSSGATVPGALVTVVNEDTGLRRMTLSLTDGGYAVSSLEPGIYKITVRKPGFRTVIRFGVKLTATEPARVDFKLVVGSVQETITVEGSAPLLDGDSTSVGTVVGRDQIENLPLNGGGLLNLLELAPGVVVTPATRGEAGQFTVNGQRPNTHYFMVDGVSANSGVSGGGLPAQSTGGTLPGMTAFGSLDDLVSLDALQEARVQTSSTGPGFGRLPGAQISLSSRAGSNELHGSLMFALRNDALDANDWFANRQGDPRAPLRLQDYGATLGGPLWRNHTFFFLSYEGEHLLQPLVSLQAVPSLDERATAPAWAQPLLNLFPLPNGPSLGSGLSAWTGNVSRPSRLNIGAARLDQAITNRLTAFGRFSESPSSTEFGASPVDFLDLRSRSITAGFDVRARSNLTAETRLNSESAKSRSVWQAASGALPDCYVQPIVAGLFPTINSCEYLVRFAISGVGQVVAGSEGRRSQSQYQAAESVTWNPRSHTIQFGADYRRLAPVRSDASNALNVIASSLDDLVNTSNLWKSSAPPQYARAVVSEISVFAEDTWQVTKALTFKYGLRWEISPAPQSDTPANILDPTTGTATSVQQSIWGSTYANFAPRFGLAYRLGAKGRTVLRAGAGYYFDSSLSLATDLVNNGPLSVGMLLSSRTAPFNSILEFGFAPNLRLPLVREWNATLEHAFDEHNVLSIAYAGSSGRDLIRREIGGVGTDDRYWLALATNNGSSDYHSLQVQYRRRMTHGLQAQASYAWSHSIDNSSTDSGLYWLYPNQSPRQDRASSDFDVRQVFTAGFAYEVPFQKRAPALRGWTLEGMFRARSGFPINVLDAEQYMGIAFENIQRPNLVGGQPVWINNPSAPGGRQLNPAAFQAVSGSQQGSLGRNALTGFGMSQLDLAIRRDFFASERRALELRIEAFNALNQANFADQVRFLSNPLFGQSNSMLNYMLGTGSPGSGLAAAFQSGGARSLQVGLRFKF